MTDRDALLRAICANPEDDAPRLIYADWLDEHGDPLQAEFIRLQIGQHQSDETNTRQPWLCYQRGPTMPEFHISSRLNRGLQY